MLFILLDAGSGESSLFSAAEEIWQPILLFMSNVLASSVPVRHVHKHTVQCLCQK